jgi:hypothetical protein
MAKKMEGKKATGTKSRTFPHFLGGHCQASTGLLTLNVFLLSFILSSGFGLVYIFCRLLFNGKYFRWHTLALLYYPLPLLSTLLMGTVVTYFSIFQACAFQRAW